MRTSFREAMSRRVTRSMITYPNDNPYMNQEAENQEESGEDMVEEEVEQVGMGETLEEKVNATMEAVRLLGEQLRAMQERDLDRGASGRDAVVSGGPSQGFEAEADTQMRPVRDATTREHQRARVGVTAFETESRERLGHVSGVSASEARGIAARAENLHLAGTFQDRIPPFDPERTEGARAWFSRVEQYMGVTGMQGLAMRKMFLSSKLRGQAELWMESTGEKLESWASVRESFLQEYLDELAIERAWYALSRVKDSSSFKAYWASFERTARNTEEDIWENQRIRGAFYFNLCGRRKERLLSHSLMLGCRVEELTLKVMVDVLKYVEKAYVGESRGEARGVARGESNTADNREKKKPAAASSGKEKACFRCGKIGHWKRDCPMKKTSVAAVIAEEQSSCSESEENDDGKTQPELCRVYAEDLFSPHDNLADMRPLQLIVEAAGISNKRARRRNTQTTLEEIRKKFERRQEMTVDLDLGGRVVKALIDTGANRSCVNAELAEELNFGVTKETVKAKLANQSEMKILGRVEIPIKVLGKQITAPFLVCELGNLERPVILGRDILREVGVLISLGKDGEEIVQLDQAIPEAVDNDDNDDNNDDDGDEDVCAEEIAATEAQLTEQMQTQKERSGSETRQLPAEFQEYADVFQPLPNSPPPERPKHDLKIELEGPPPNAVKQYRLSTSEREELRKQVAELKEAGLIRPSQASFTSPILFVPKKTGEKRMCVDFRRLNAATKSYPNTLPLIEDILEGLHGTAVFTTLDLRSGYWQLGLAPEARQWTAFQAEGETYEWNVVPFGLKNAPTVFQQFMRAVVQGIPSAHVYLDDIIIATTTREENVRDVCRVLQKLRDNNLRCKLSKCEFFETEIDYLGHRVTSDGLQAQKAKVDAVIRGKRPENLGELRSFLGLTGYYRRFVQNYGVVAQPLTDLLRKGIPYEWKEPQQQAYQELKRRITSAPVLALPDPGQEFLLTTDASDQGVGSVLSQGGRPIAFFSKRLNPAQSRYTTGEKELMAVVLSLEHFRHLVDGRRTVVNTDHRNLLTALTRPRMNARMIRAITYLQQYDVVLRYIDGKSNNVADHLSRYPITMASLAVFELSNHNFEDIVRETEGDSEAAELVERKQGELKNGILYIHGRAFVPTAIRMRVIAAHHDGAHAGHRGVATTVERIRRSFFWPGLETDVREYIGRCEVCQTTKSGNAKPLGRTRPLELPTQKFQQISIDFVTHLPATTQGKDCICVIVDTATKYAAFIPVKSTDTAREIAETVLTHWVLKGFGVPRQVISDRDPKFTSHLWKTLTAKLGVQLKMSSSHHPQTDGQTERTIRTLNQYLRAYVQTSGKNWIKSLSYAEFAYNDAVNVTGYSPYQLLLGQNPELPWQMIVPGKTELEQVNKFCKRMQESISRALYSLERSRMRSAHRMDKGRRTGEYQVGDRVFVNTRLFKTSLPGIARFKPTFIGPFTIMKKLGNSYQVDLQGQYNMHPVFNTTELKKAQS